MNSVPWFQCDFAHMLFCCSVVWTHQCAYGDKLAHHHPAHLFAHTRKDEAEEMFLLTGGLYMTARILGNLDCCSCTELHTKRTLQMCHSLVT